MSKSSVVFFLFFTILSFFNSCDENSTPSIPDSLIGEWSNVSFSATTTSNRDIDGVPSVLSSEIIGQNWDYNLTFEENTWFTEGDYEVSVVTEIDGQIVSEEIFSYFNESNSNSYTMTGDSITIMSSFINLEIDGANIANSAGTQSFQYEINSSGELILNGQVDVLTNVDNIEQLTTITTTFVWVQM